MKLYFICNSEHFKEAILKFLYATNAQINTNLFYVKQESVRDNLCIGGI